MASHARRHLTRCPVGGKRRFRDETEAVEALHRAVAAPARGLANRERTTTRRRECRAYPCRVCQGWHLTSAATAGHRSLAPLT